MKIRFYGLLSGLRLIKVKNILNIPAPALRAKVSPIYYSSFHVLSIILIQPHYTIVVSIFFSIVLISPHYATVVSIVFSIILI